MKRTTTKEIYIEIETIRVTRKRWMRKNAAQETKTDVSNGENSVIKTDACLKRLFDQIL